MITGPARPIRTESPLSTIDEVKVTHSTVRAFRQIAELLPANQRELGTFRSATTELGGIEAVAAECVGPLPVYSFPDGILHTEARIDARGRGEDRGHRNPRWARGHS